MNLQTVQSQIQAAGNTSSGRMQALAAANVGFNLKQGADALKAGQGNAADNARGSSVNAGGTTTIQATGGGAASNLTVQGSEVSGSTVRLQADNQVNLLASQSTRSQTQSSSITAPTNATTTAEKQ